MSSEKEFTGIWRIVSIPPRIFDWVLDHKILTLLALGAAYWGWGEIKDVMRHRAYRQRQIEEQKKAEAQALIQAKQWKKQQVEIKKSEGLTFRNMTIGPDAEMKRAEELKKMAQQAEEKRQVDQAVSNAVKYAFASTPKLQPLPVATNRLDKGVKR